MHREYTITRIVNAWLVVRIGDLSLRQFGRKVGLIELHRLSLHSSNPSPLMSALGQKQTFECIRAMSALPPKADIGTQPPYVRFVPKADIALIPKTANSAMPIQDMARRPLSRLELSDLRRAPTVRYR